MFMSKDLSSVNVSIIIPHHNNKKILKDCLDSLYQSSYKKFEIIIVDNASSDKSVEEIQSFYKDIKIIKSLKNLGYAGGCNLGAKNANGKYLLFLNNDTILDIDCVKFLIPRLESNSKIASVQPKIKNLKNKSYFDYAGASGGFMDYLVFPFTRGRIFNTIEKDNGQYDNACRIFWASGTAFLTRKTIFSQLAKH